MSEKIEYTKSSGNVFADVGIPNPEEAKLKADLAIKIGGIIKDRHLTQKKAAEVLGITQPHVSDILRGKLLGYSIERLIRLLNVLGQSVELVVKPTEFDSKDEGSGVQEVAHTASVK